MPETMKMIEKNLSESLTDPGQVQEAQGSDYMEQTKTNSELQKVAFHAHRTRSSLNLEGRVIKSKPRTNTPAPNSRSEGR
ncbi:hypothetical protein Acr_07g0006260 [Actinidia rufa]|uniref:Uncharacterized protein n=1 Tax=Actinidia rufa TaxID=165716 RepID=A0A7J0EWU2_9ERIC|nr:hypothetical protein Acr_07g0006260 [Actinidia rufa]